MRIEDFWTDVYAYYVTFLTTNGVRITKLIVLPENYLDHDNICELIKNKFNNVAQVLLIDDLDAGLVLK